MTPADAVKIARYIRAHFPQQPIDEYTSEALAELLADYAAEDARTAVLNIAKRGEQWCAPTAIAAEVKRIRRDRIEKHPPLIPPPGLSELEERRFLAAARRRIGDGETYDSDAAWHLVAAPERLRELIASADPEGDPA